MEGVFPLAPTLDHLGIICQDAQDLIILTRALGMNVSLDDFGGDNKAMRTMGILDAPSDVPVEQSISNDFSAVAERLRRDHDVVEVKTRLDEAYSIFATLVLAEGGMTHFSRSCSRLIGERYSRETFSRLERARTLSIGDFARAQEARQAFSAKIASLFEQIELLILPTCPCPAPRIGEEEVQIGAWSGDIRKALMTYTAPFNLVGYPAVTLPLPRRAASLPAGLQIVGRSGRDSDVVNAAVQLQKLAVEVKRDRSVN